MPKVVEFERHPTADREPVEHIGHLEAFGVVERDRPEGVHGRRGAFVEVEGVFARAIERLAGVVEKVQRIDRIFGEVGAEADLRDHGALQVVVAIDTHGVGVHGPTIHDPGERRYLPLHELLGVSGRAFQRLLHGGVEFVEVEALAGLDADPLHLRDDRLVGDVDRVKLKEFGRVGEVFAGRHGIDLNLRRRLHVHRRVNLDRHLGGRFS